MGGHGLRVAVHAAGAGVLAAALASTAACASATCPGFSLSVADHGGQPTPVAAAEWFAAHSTQIASVPGTGWHETGHDDNGVLLRSGDATLHAFQGPDQTWQIDSGRAC
jgi:hypothetical protein